VPIFRIGAPSACWGGPRFFSGCVTTTTSLDQQLSHPLNRLVIFDLRGARRRHVLYDQLQRLLGAARLGRAGSSSDRFSRFR
jgi:hypothetical protein